MQWVSTINWIWLIIGSLNSAEDSHGLYGSDYAASKVAGHELKGLLAYFNLGLRDLCLPLMVHMSMLLNYGANSSYWIQALIDYRGFRLLAMSILPIKKSTIVYGSNDYGHTIHAENKKLCAKMRLAAKKLNIKPHMCGVVKSQSKELCSPADLEGHIGDDGRTYLLVHILFSLSLCSHRLSISCRTSRA